MTPSEQTALAMVRAGQSFAQSGQSTGVPVALIMQMAMESKDPVFRVFHERRN